MVAPCLQSRYSYGFVVCGLHLLCYREALVQHSVIMRTTRRLRESGECVGQLGGPRNVSEILQLTFQYFSFFAAKEGELLQLTFLLCVPRKELHPR